MIAAALAVVAALALAQDAPVAPAPAAPPAPDAPEPVRPKDAGASAQNTPMERETDEAWRDSVERGLAWLARAQNEDGSFAPVKLQLDPAMNPVAVNFKGTTIAHPNESARWNAYVANLTRNGSAIASASFTINNPGTRDNDHGGPFVQTLFFVTVPEAGEYELNLGVTRPKEITIQEPRLEVRRNTQPPPR